MALAIAVALAFSTCFVSYHRQRTVLVEAVTGCGSERRWGGALLGWLVPDQREQAVLVFMMKTLTRSSYHRLIIIG